MGFDACVRTTSRTVQRDAWLRHDRLTELVAWKGDVGVKDAIYVPVRYRLPVRGKVERSDPSWVRPVAAVLEAVRAFLADSARAANGDPSYSTARKPIVLSFTSAEEPDGLGDVPAPGESLVVSTAWVASAAGPQSPRVNIPDAGWMVGQIRSTESRVAFPGPEIELPVGLAELIADSADSTLCESGERCDLIVPANPPLHVNAMFFPDDSQVGTDEARRMGERTGGSARGGQVTLRGRAPRVPGRADGFVVVALAVRASRAHGRVGVHRSAGTDQCGDPHRPLGQDGRWTEPAPGRIPAFRLGHCAVLPATVCVEARDQRRNGQGHRKNTSASAKRADEALRSWAEAHVGAVSGAWADGLLTEAQAERSRMGRWAKEAAAWEKRKNGLCGKVADCKGLVSTCVREDEKARSAGKTARERMDGIRSYLRDVEQQQELASELKREAGEARELGKKARHLAGSGRPVGQQGQEGSRRSGVRRDQARVA